MTDMLQLKCRICGQPAEISRFFPESYRGIAFDFMEWSDFIDDHPYLNEQIWPRSETPPCIGEKRIVKVSFPFCFRIGDEFNVLFQPALSFFNGWDEHPDEIESSAIVSCRFLSVLDSNENEAWIEIAILSVIMLTDLLDVCPEYPIPSVFSFDGYNYVFKSNCWTFCSWSAEGDIGEWTLLYTDKNGTLHELLSAHSEFHHSHIYYGNITYLAPK